MTTVRNSSSTYSGETFRDISLWSNTILFSQESQDDDKIMSRDEEKRDEEKAEDENDLDLRAVPTTESKHRKRSLSLSIRKTKSSKKNTGMRVEHYPETNMEAGLVGWEGQNDPLHPRNFPQSKKWLFLAMIAGITFLTYEIHLSKY